MGRFLAIILFLITLLALGGAAVVYQKGIKAEEVIAGFEKEKSKLAKQISELKSKIQSAGTDALKLKDAEAEVSKVSAELKTTQSKLAEGEGALAAAKKEAEEAKSSLADLQKKLDDALAAKEAAEKVAEEAKAELVKATAAEKQ